MASAPTIYSVGGIRVNKGDSYTTADLPTFSPSVVIDTVRIVEAPRLWREDLARDGTPNIKDGKPNYIRGNQRGVRVLIQRTGATFNVGKPNTPVLYKEGEEIAIHADNTYTFFNDCVVEFGVAK